MSGQIIKEPKQNLGTRVPAEIYNKVLERAIAKDSTPSRIAARLIENGLKEKSK